MIKKADKDGSGYITCNEFSELLGQNLFDIAEGLNVGLEKPGGNKKMTKSSHRSVIGRNPKANRSTYGKKMTFRR
jgi:hypothetical protein